MWNIAIITRKSWISLILTLFLFFSTQSLYASADDYAKFVTVADIHFDPFSQCVARKYCPLINKLRSASYQQWEALFDKYSTQSAAVYYIDTNYPLLKATIQELQRINQREHPVFVIVLGDFLAHDFRDKYRAFSGDRSKAGYQAFVRTTLQFMSYELQKAFPDTDIYSVVGNNDSYTGDYSVIPNGPFLSDTMRTWAGLIKNEEHKASFNKTFSYAGYYAVTLPNEQNDKVIVLNTVLFSSNSINKGAKLAAVEQLNWLNRQLEEASQHNQHVIIACHIPLGIDIFDTIQSGFDLKEFWRVDFAEKFIKELKEYSRTVTAFLAGHMHTEIFKMTVPKKIGSVPVYITPSISPVFGNDPGLKIYIYEKETFRTKDIDTIYFYHPTLTGKKT